MKIRITSLRTGRNELTELVEPIDVGLSSDIYKTPLTVNIEADKGGGRITFKVETRGKGLYLCDRCGEEIESEQGGECQVVFVQREEQFPEEEPGDDLRSFGLHQEEIDIATEVRDALLLSLPMQILCREDCRGRCPGCGVNLNSEQCRCKQPDNE